ncbi:hypothetical protein GOV07_05650 [Candidatus Woesearchaeota archaeon]|nr:hypothetical protein [Candidatus Woesearchaeota archaeon]
MEFVIFEKGMQERFLREIKENSRKTWRELAERISKSKGMMFFYLNEDSLMTKQTFETLRKHSTRKYNVKYQTVPNTPIDCSIPKKMTDDLAEFLGVMAGDGHRAIHQYALVISISNLVDKEYGGRIVALFDELFSIQAKKRVLDNLLQIFIYSKQAWEFIDKYHPIGKKKNKLHIPSLNKKHLKAYLRGLFDTDGSFYERGSGRAVVNISSRDPQFLNETKESLINLGFHPSVSGKNLNINRKAEIDRFFRLIRPANPKHQEKYHGFKRQYLKRNKQSCA